MGSVLLCNGDREIGEVFYYVREIGGVFYYVR
jgi:hypothetical protein